DSGPELRPMRPGDALFRVIVTAFAALIPLILLALLAFLVHDSWPALRFNGFEFFTRNAWNLGNQYGNPVTVRGEQVMPGASFAILFLIVGTLASSLIALLLAVPLGVGAAVFRGRGGATAHTHLRVAAGRAAGLGTQRGFRPGGVTWC
ncbi:membrane protein, partial [mine drainage metagenome]